MPGLTSGTTSTSTYTYTTTATFHTSSTSTPNLPTPVYEDYNTGSVEGCTCSECIEMNETEWDFDYIESKPEVEPRPEAKYHFDPATEEKVYEG